MQKRCKWTKREVKHVKKEEKKMVFQCNVKSIRYFCSSGCRVSFLTEEAPLALCERPAFAEVSSSIPSEFSVSRRKPDKTRTVN